MAAIRFLRIMSRPVEQKNCSCPAIGSVKVRCISNSSGENWVSCTRHHGEGKRRKTTADPVEVKAMASNSGCVITSNPKTDKLVDLAPLFADVADFSVALIRRLSLVIKSMPWKWHLQNFMEKVIMNCRFFTMLAVGGSLLGSLLCFVEGFVLIVESYLQYFHPLSQGSAQEHLVHLLIEAMDMFLVATAMLVFGTGLHVMFVGSSVLRGKGSQFLQQSNYRKTLPSRVGIHTIMQAKSKIGQAVIMILQVAMLEKFKTIPLVSSFDLACFAGAVFTSSACIFLLSKLAVRIIKLKAHLLVDLSKQSSKSTFLLQQFLLDATRESRKESKRPKKEEFEES